MKFTSLIASAIIAAAPGFASAGTAKCLLEIGGKKIIDGPCIFSPQSGGSFMIGSTKTAEGRWGPISEFYASVLIESPGVASAFWNEEPFAGHAHSTLGTVRRSGEDRACWENSKAKICAW